MKNLKYVLFALLVVGLLGGWYAYSEYNRKPKDLSELKADVEIDAAVLIGAYSNDENAANQLYLNKKLAVKGKIASIQKDDKELYTISLGTDVDISSVSCEMDLRHNEDAANLQVGNEVVMKGICTGYLTDVVLNMCVVQK